MCAGCALVVALVWPVTACADAGLPMLFVVWPSAWALFLPVVWIDYVAEHLFAQPFRRCFRISLVANAWSTLVGIPLTWLVLTLLEMGSAYGLALRQIHPEGVWWARWSLMAPWLGGGESP